MFNTRAHVHVNEKVHKISLLLLDQIERSVQQRRSLLYYIFILMEI